MLVKEVRNKWLCSNQQIWTKDITADALTVLMELAKMIPSGLLQFLNNRHVIFPGIAFHSNIHTFKSCIKDGKHQKVQFKIEKLQSDQGQEIYVERSYLEIGTDNKTSEVGDLLLPNRVVLLKGEAGAGKSSVTTKLIQRWAEGKEAEDIACMLFLSAGSDGKLSLQQSVWDGNTYTADWEKEDFREAYIGLRNLAIEGKVAVLIDGLDEFGNMTLEDVSNASQAAANPQVEVNLRTVCAGILSQKIFPGARILATGRVINLINEHLLGGKANLYYLVPFNEDDRDAMVEQMEVDDEERVRVNEELQRISTKSNEVFFKSPLMLKSVIQLVIERKVETHNLKCSSEVYLMLAMKNLDFQTDKNTSFLELDPPEDQDYLKMCLMVCQQKIHKPGGSIYEIKGMQLLVCHRINL